MIAVRARIKVERGLMTSSQMEETIEKNVSDEFSSMSCHVSAMSPAALKRKKNKPLIEKRRRARINDCLLQLKSIITKDQPGQRYKANRLEKADILELTVDYIKEVKDSSKAGHELGNHKAAYENGFSRCLQEIKAFLASKHHDFKASQVSAIQEHCNDLLRQQLNSASKDYDTIDSSLSEVDECCCEPSTVKRKKTGATYDFRREESPDSTESQHRIFICSEIHSTQNAQSAFDNDDSDGGGKNGHDSLKAFMPQSATDNQTISSSTNSVLLSRPTIATLTEKSKEDISVSETFSIDLPISLSAALPSALSLPSDISSPSPPIASLSQPNLSFTSSSSSSPHSSASSLRPSAPASKSAEHSSLPLMPAHPISLTTPVTPSSLNACSDSGIILNKEDGKPRLNTPHLDSALSVNLPSQPTSEITVPSSPPYLLSMPGPIFIILNHRNDLHPSADTAPMGEHSTRENVSFACTNSKGIDKADTDVITPGRNENAVCGPSLQFYKSLDYSAKPLTSISNEIHKSNNKKCLCFLDGDSKSNVSDTFLDKNTDTSNLKLTPFGDNPSRTLVIERSEDSIRHLDNAEDVTFNQFCTTGIKELLDGEADNLSDKTPEECTTLEQCIAVRTKMIPTISHVLEEEDVHSYTKPDVNVPLEKNFISGDARVLTPQLITNSTPSSSSHFSHDVQHGSQNQKLQTLSNVDMFNAEKEKLNPSVPHLGNSLEVNSPQHDPTLEQQAEWWESKSGKGTLSTNPQYDISHSMANIFQNPSSQQKGITYPQTVGMFGCKISTHVSVDANKIESEDTACNTNDTFPRACAKGEVIQPSGVETGYSKQLIKLPLILETCNKVNKGDTDGLSVSSTGNAIVPFLANHTNSRNYSTELPRNCVRLYPYTLHEAPKVHFLTNVVNENHTGEVLDLRVRKDPFSSKTNFSETLDGHFEDRTSSNASEKSPSMNTSNFACRNTGLKAMDTSNNINDVYSYIHKKEGIPSVGLFTEKQPAIRMSVRKSENNNNNNIVPIPHNASRKNHSIDALPTIAYHAPKTESNPGQIFSRDFNNNNIVFIGSIHARNCEGSGTQTDISALQEPSRSLVLSGTPQQESGLTNSTPGSALNKRNEVWRPW